MILNRLLRRGRYSEEDIYPVMVVPEQHAELSEQLPESSEYASDASDEASETSENTRKSIISDMTLHSQRWKAVRTSAGIDNMRLIAVPFAIAVVLTACALTYFKQSYIVQVQGYCMAMIAVMIIDPLRLIERILAPQTRYIISIFAIVMIVGIGFKSLKFLGAYFLAATLAAWVCWKLNSEWLSAYLWMMSEAVQHTLVQDETAEAVLHWNDAGERGLRTIYAETGLEFNKMVLTTYGKYAYIFGFYNGRRRTTAAENMVERAELELEEAEEENQKLVERLKLLEKANAQLKASEEKHSAEMREFADSVSDLKAYCAAIEQRNQEMSEELEEYRRPKELEILEREMDFQNKERAKAMLAAGQSIRTVAKTTGISQYHVEKLKKEMKNG